MVKRSDCGREDCSQNVGTWYKPLIVSDVCVVNKRFSAKPPFIMSRFFQGVCLGSVEIEIGFVGENCVLVSSVAVLGVACVHSILLKVIVPSGSEDIGVVSIEIEMEVIDKMRFLGLLMKA
jgi:hypothetical protein